MSEELQELQAERLLSEKHSILVKKDGVVYVDSASSDIDSYRSISGLGGFLGGYVFIQVSSDEVVDALNIHLIILKALYIFV